MNIKIRITKKTIAGGVRLKTEQCPVALALMEVPGVTWASVGSPSVAVSINGKHLTGHMSRRCERFVEQFDSKEKVKPATFVITLKGV